MAAKTVKAAKTEKISRATAANRVVKDLKGASTLSELAAAAEAIVVASGVAENLKASTANVRRALETAETFGMVRLTKPTDILVERTK